jgi:hypothetical protein
MLFAGLCKRHIAQAISAFLMLGSRMPVPDIQNVTEYGSSELERNYQKRISRRLVVAVLFICWLSKPIGHQSLFTARSRNADQSQ